MIFVAQPWDHLRSQKGTRRGGAACNRGPGRHGATSPCNSPGFRQGVRISILGPCSVPLGRHHNLLFGGSERVSLTGGKKQGKPLENIKIIVINIHGMLLRSQALLKRSIFINSLKSHSNAPEVRAHYYVYFKGKEMEAQKSCSAINRTTQKLDLSHNRWHCSRNCEDIRTIREHPGQGCSPRKGLQNRFYRLQSSP